MTPAVKLLSAIAAAAILFAIGVAVGEALHDNPTPNLTVTHTKTLTP
jgi:di/tricarboxylate transporter